MKNKFLLIAFSLLFVVSGITFYFTNQNINTYADSVPIASETYDVNFIAPDNSILYEVENISNGVSLNDINNSSKLENSSFLNNSLGLTTYIADGWGGNDYCIDNWFFRGVAGNSLIVNSDKSVTINNVWFYQFLPIENFVLGNTYTFSVNIISASNYFHCSFVGSDNQYDAALLVGQTLQSSFTGIYNLSYTIPLDYSYSYIGIRFYGGPVTINYVYLRESTYQNTYFNFDYLNYLLSEYDSSDVTYSYDYDFSLPILNNLFYYPTKILNLYDQGYNDGIDYATEMLQGFGIFNYSTYSLVNRFDYNELIGSFTGRVTEDNFVKFNGGFIIGSELFSSIDDYLYVNEISDVVLKFDFDSNISVKTTPYFIFYNFSFGNQVEFIFSDGSKLSLNSADSKFDSVSLDSYTSFYIKSIVLGFSSNFADYGQVGISSNVNYSNAYNNGLTDGFNNGYDNGYLNGLTDGKVSGYNSGYNNGLVDGGNYSFFSLFGAVLDAPVKTLTGLFNFDLLGVNLWSFFTALFTLAVIILIVKLCLGGK